MPASIQLVTKLSHMVRLVYILVLTFLEDTRRRPSTRALAYGNKKPFVHISVKLNNAFFS